MAEYKPAFGVVFEDFLAGYSHWGYCDLDMALGNVPFFLEANELEQYDIVSYGFDDLDAIYLRGQWTVHRNDAEKVNQVWRKCAHLGAGLQLELGNKVSYLRQMEAQGKKSFATRFLSAEGCYSWQAVREPGVRVKLAFKQAVGIDVPSSKQALVVAGAVWHCAASVQPDAALLHALQLHTAREPCRVDLPAAVKSRGEPAPLAVQAEGCGKWIPADFRMCAATLSPAEGKPRQAVVVTAREGSFHSTTVDEDALDGPSGCRQQAFFHFQEWKKNWEETKSRIAPLRPADTLTSPSFRITPDGISPLTIQ